MSSTRLAQRLYRATGLHYSRRGNQDVLSGEQATAMRAIARHHGLADEREAAELMLADRSFHGRALVWLFSRKEENLNQMLLP